MQRTICAVRSNMRPSPPRISICARSLLPGMLAGIVGAAVAVALLVRRRLRRRLAAEPPRALFLFASTRTSPSSACAAVHGCDAALIQGGAVRGKAEYAKGKFTFGDLMREFAFECEMAVVQLPGRV